MINDFNNHWFHSKESSKEGFKLAVKGSTFILPSILLIVFLGSSLQQQEDLNCSNADIQQTSKTNLPRLVPVVIVGLVIGISTISSIYS